MFTEVREYLEDVRSHLHLDAVTERRIIGELYSYFRDKIPELQEEGLSEKEAAREAVRSCGRTRVVARLMYEAHSKGNWTEALLSSLPHIIVAGLFATHLWNHPVLMPVVFVSVVAVTLYGWWHGKPNWMYSWIGYALLPLLAGGYASHAILGQTVSFLKGISPPPDIRIFILICAFLAIATWIVIRTSIRVVKRDWILASLMLVPLPVIGSWFYEIEQFTGLFRNEITVLNRWDTPMAIVLIMLAAASAIFIRMRKRIYKGIALMTLTFISMMIIGHILWEDQGFFGLLAASILSLIFLISPVFLEAKIGHGELKEDIRWPKD